MMRKFSKLLAQALLMTLLVATAQAQTKSKTFKTEETTISVEVIASDLVHPWGMTMLPNNKILVTERGGTLKLVNSENGKIQNVLGVPRVRANGQGGLLDITADPDFENNRTVFITFSDASIPNVTGTAVASATFTETQRPRLNNVKTIYSMQKKTAGGRHFGSRIVFGRDGNLFITTGDRGDRPRAQDPFDAAGKVLRIAKDGSIPADNPFADGKEALPEIWSIGHRNPQGATLNDKTGDLWTLSHGARGGDEINIPKAGKNYGWPIISYGVHYSGGKIGKGTSATGLEQPIYYWDPSIAPSGFDFYQGDLIPQWKGNLFAGALKDQLLSRLEIKDNKVIHEEQILEGDYGRIRDVRSFSDGALWLLTDDSEGMLLRITTE
jgi:glucose/arabinose dehydrogenase